MLKIKIKNARHQNRQNKTGPGIPADRKAPAKRGEDRKLIMRSNKKPILFLHTELCVTYFKTINFFCTVF